MNVTADLFRKATGRDPIEDDLERANCDRAGIIGHYHCGWSSLLNLPMAQLSSSAIEAERALREPELNPYKTRLKPG